MSKFIWEEDEVRITPPKPPAKKTEPEPNPVDRNQPPK